MRSLAPYAIFFLSIIGATASYGNDTLHVSMQQADSLFLQNNYYLLASAYNIDIEKAHLIQAKLYPNPVFTADVNGYDPNTRKAFRVGGAGQKLFQIDQLIVLGGKRRASIDIAKTNIALAEKEFAQLVLELKANLHKDLFASSQHWLLIQKYTAQLALLDTLLQSYDTQVQKGNIALKDLVRLKSSYMRINNDRAEQLEEYFAIQNKIQLLLGVESEIRFDVNQLNFNAYIQEVSFGELEALMQANQPGIQLAALQKERQTNAFALAKAERVPDVNVFTYYDQRSGAFDNQINLGIAIPLPLFHRNQGAIKAAETEIKQANMQEQFVNREYQTRLRNSFLQYKQALNEYNTLIPMYNADFDTTINGITTNFRKRNVSVLEFMDFFESYNEAATEIGRVKTQLIKCAEELNLITGKELFK